MKQNHEIISALLLMIQYFLSRSGVRCLKTMANLVWFGGGRFEFKDWVMLRLLLRRARVI